LTEIYVPAKSRARSDVAPRLDCASNSLNGQQKKPSPMLSAKKSLRASRAAACPDKKLKG
jgi:hypothetical protein